MTIPTNDLPEAPEGKPIVIITPAPPAKPRPGPGFMKGQGEILGDIISPVEQPWEVLQ